MGWQGFIHQIDAVVRWIYDRYKSVNSVSQIQMCCCCVGEERMARIQGTGIAYIAEK